jgi:PAS domain-containing protein
MFPVELAQQGRVCVLCLCEDVTDAVHAQESLLRSEESLKNAQRIARIGNWDWDIRTGTLHWSDEIFRIFGLEEDFTPSYEAFMHDLSR